MTKSLLSLMWAFPGVVCLTDMYVDKTDPNRGSAKGSQAAPRCTIQQALGSAVSGDTVRVAPGP